MRRGLPVFFSLAFMGCGARTGLEDGPADAGMVVHADAQTGADANADTRTETDAHTPTDGGPSLCPRRPPAANSACETHGLAILCAYLDDGPSSGIDAWDCNFGGWVSATTEAYTTFTTCSEIVCDSKVYVECIRGDGQQCCECGADMTADLCGPC